MSQYGSYAPKTRKILTSQDKIIDVADRTGGIAVIETKHHYIHTGDAFNMDFYGDINAATTYIFHGVNESEDKSIHLQPPHFAEGNFLMEFITGAVYTPQLVTPNPSYNLNRGSEKESAFKVYPQPPALPITGGTVFAREYQKPINQLIEWIIPPGESYLAKFYHLGASPTKYFIRLFWYEI